MELVQKRRLREQYYLFNSSKVASSTISGNKIEAKKNATDDEYKKVLEERGKAWDKHLEKQKYKNISKESQVGKSI